MDILTEKRFENVSRSKTFKNIVAIFSLNKKSVLDLGCSFGEHLIHFGKGSMGVTIARNEADYGATKGLTIWCANIESNDFSLDEKFDVVFSNNLFEHLYSPHAFLIKIKEYMKPDGLLILGVPCVPKLAFLMHFKKFRGSLAEAHINFFTRETLQKTAERAGYSLVMLRGFHFENILLDRIFDLIYPHFYLIAKPNQNFDYTEKRKKELSGYKLNS